MDIDMSVLRMLEREKEISFDILVEAIEQALLTAYHKSPGAQPHARVELDRRQSRSGGLLGGLFGESDRNNSRRPYQPQPPVNNQGAYNQGGYGARGPWGQQGGGGFLAGAAQTALGVTGGVLLGSAIAGMVGGAFAGEHDAADQPEDVPEDTGGDLGDSGGDFGDGGDFGGGEF